MVMFGLLLVAILVTFIMACIRFYKASNAGVYEPNLIANDIEHRNLVRDQWWSQKRLEYNIWLLAAGFVAFISFAVLGESLIAPHDPNFEITIFTIFFQGIGYLIAVLLANLFYNLGPTVDQLYNRNDSQIFRERLFALGLWFSCGLPFLAPLLITVQYFVRFSGH
jgi:hypothetical protein